MNIPADVKTQAHDALRVDCNVNDEYAVIAAWARKEALREAAQQVRDYWDACGELIDSNNSARLAFDAVAAQIADVSS